MIEYVGGADQGPCGQRAHPRGLPVVGDDPVPLTEQIRELRDRHQHGRNVPRRLHRRREPFTRPSKILRHVAQIAFQPSDLGRLTFSFHEQHAVEL